MHFIVKYFPEITIKSTPVRKRIVTQLQRNLKNLLQPLDANIHIRKGWDRLEVISETATTTQTERVADRLAATPGIAYFAEVVALNFSSLPELGEKVLPLWQDALVNKSFCVRVKRTGTQNFQSIDVEREVGGVLNRACATARVQLHDPEITVKLEVMHDQCFVVLKQRQGLGGFPLGTQDAVLSLMSGGFDSTVASYLTTKRGLLTHFCFFNLGGDAHEFGVKEVSYFLWQRFGASHPVKFISIPFAAVVEEILQNIHHSQMGVVLKRMMLRLANRVAADMRIQALVTGESVAQVASQTLQNLAVIDSVSSALILRPLITFDKGEIINLSRKIGTEEYAASMPEYCGVISVKPTTRATEERVAREEENFNWQVLETAYAQRQVQSITDVAKTQRTSTPIAQVAEPSPEDIVIDIRHPNEEEKQPLSLPLATLKKIPFYRLNKQFPQLPAHCRYLLYCDKGVMSQLHAGHLVAGGHSNVGVYRPTE